jgi:hypothetical protein
MFYNFLWGGQRGTFGDFSSFDEVFFRLGVCSEVQRRAS